MATVAGTFESLSLRETTLLPGLFRDRAELNRAYLLRLATASLLQNHYLEAGLWQPVELPADAHGGWETPSSQARGHFLGHWLSAASRLAAGGDLELAGRAAAVVAALARCQEENGGEWVFSVPAKFLDWVARGKQV